MAATEASSSSSSVSGDDCINTLDSSLSSNGTAFSSSASFAIDFLSLCHRLKEAFLMMASYCPSQYTRIFLDKQKVFEALEMVLFFKLGVRPRSWSEPNSD
ncbi:hypothetical protein LWI29_002000 [Acer saccharum]|uniref:Uncharacterized protein n=1 Tax=Acer saccharum TaxID=4024 RepID=A0AA39VU93_ACESA|nr:hypothetical protein LWI29_002000 [Acer saccharum]